MEMTAHPTPQQTPQDPPTDPTPRHPPPPSLLALTNDVVMDTMYEHVTLGSWMLLVSSNKEIRAAYTRMVLRNLDD